MWLHVASDAPHQSVHHLQQHGHPHLDRPHLDRPHQSLCSILNIFQKWMR